jgi:hypothetical protein
LVSAFVAPAVWATTAIMLAEGEMIAEAEVVVTGRCSGVQSQWLDRDLVTLATIEVSEVLKGQAGSTLTVVLPGGVDVNRPVPVAMTFPAAPEIYLGEEVLLFLIGEDRVAQGFGIVGFSQGKFSLVEDAAGGKAATQDLSALSLVGRNGSTWRGSAKTINLEQLRQRIRQLSAPQAR